MVFPYIDAEKGAEWKKIVKIVKIVTRDAEEVTSDE
jgi:hypothetical protein